MGKIVKPLPVKLIVGLITQEATFFDKAKNILSKKFGNIDFISPVLAFDQTAYYQKEMGRDLKRLFLSFEKLIPADKLVAIKLSTNKIEQKISTSRHHRCVNIDPGYIALSKLVLATTKSFLHRLYIGAGIHEEITLYFRKNTFEAGPWTYPDYRLPTQIALFNEIRKKYYEQVEKKYGHTQLYRCL